ncbi:response regulator [Tissierella creatinini]|nr:response regulator [Tissierella creatinini]TJX61512.1 response regulator [Soehngenia saccharolytica]
MDMDKIKVLLVEKSSSDRELISETLSKIDYINLVGEADNAEEANYFLNDNYPNVILIGTNLELDRHNLAKSISNEYPDIAIIMIENELKEDTMYKALFSGAKDVIISPFTSSKLVDSIFRAAQLVNEKSVVHKDIPVKQRRRSGRGHVITVFSTKGGVGKTFISTNLAISLAKDSDKRVCLVDLDLDFGNTVLALNMVPRFTILDIVDDIRNIDQDIIESYLIPHESGIKVLPANAKPQINEFVNSEHIEIILRALQGAFDYVVVDMPARFYEPVNPAFQVADVLLMVTTPEISAVRNIKASIQTLQELNFPKSKIKVVLNKADSSGQIKSKDVESTLNQSLYEIIDADYKQAMLSLNDGIPVTIGKPKSPISKSFNSLAKKINSEFIESGVK